MRSRPDRLAEGRICLVAVDGSDASVRALIWGFRYATDHDMHVEVLTVWPPRRSVLVHEVPGHFCAPRWSARADQADVIRQALEEVPDGSILSTSLENGDVADVIVRASTRCDLVVLGTNPKDDHHQLTAQIVEQAPCEVVVAGGRRAAR